MAYSWSIAAGVVTLTLDGTGSGPVSRSRTFTSADGITADELHTFYLTVDPSVVAIGAFLEAEGGDTTVAEETGSQTLRARGTADGSAEITVRFGAQSIEAAPGSGSSDGLNYADIAALEAASWAKTDTHTGSPVWSMEASNVTEGAKALKVVVGGGSGETYYGKVIGGFTPGESVSFSVDVYQNTKHWYDNTTGLYFGGGGHVTYASPAGTYKTLTTSKAADGAGEIEVRLRVGAIGDPITAIFDNLRWETTTGGGATIDFSDLTYCLGSGTSETGGTGAGPEGTDPLPVPPAGGVGTPGARPFGAYSIPAGGLDYWNATVKQIKPQWIANVLNTAATNSAYIFCCFGGDEDWVDSAGVFSFERWKATVYAVYNNAVANALLVAMIASGTAFAHYLIDEPNWYKRWGGVIPLATLERMALYSKSLWPTWPTTVRIGATEKANGSYYITRHVNGLDWLWAQYWTRFGDVTAYRDLEISRCLSLNHGLVIGLNIADFNGDSTRPITPAELDYYGGILAAGDNSVVKAFMAWEFQSGLYAQSTFPSTNGRLRDRFASFD